MSKVAFVREIDDLGRIVIPREYRNKIFGEHNSEGKKMEIFLEKDGSLILKPYKTEPDIIEKVTEYINELDTEITRITNDLLKKNNSDDKPYMLLNPEKKNFYDITIEDFSLTNYAARKPQLSFDLGV